MFTPARSRTASLLLEDRPCGATTAPAAPLTRAGQSCERCQPREGEIPFGDGPCAAANRGAPMGTGRSTRSTPPGRAGRGARRSHPREQRRRRPRRPPIAEICVRNQCALHPTAGAARELPRCGRGASDDGSDLLEGHGEHVVKHEMRDARPESAFSKTTRSARPTESARSASCSRSSSSARLTTGSGINGQGFTSRSVVRLRDAETAGQSR
jgi:hypothetical protein